MLLKQEFKLAFTPFNLLLSASVSGLVNVAEYSYEINKLHKYMNEQYYIYFHFKLIFN